MSIEFIYTSNKQLENVIKGLILSIYILPIGYIISTTEYVVPWNKSNKRYSRSLQGNCKNCLILTKLICEFNGIPNKNLNRIFEKMIIKCIWKNKEPRMNRRLLKKTSNICHTRYEDSLEVTVIKTMW